MRAAVAILMTLLGSPLLGQSSAYLEVTATKIEEDLLAVPGSVTVITAEEIERSGAHDLQSALALAGGVSIARGSDGGPAASVPEMWGLREADAFLLIVDGVPSGGAFGPQTEAIDLENVERIEVLRGSAPVVYGATAFSGVINVIHRRDARRVAEVHAGSYGSGGASAQIAGLTVDLDRERFRADRTGFDRGYLAWRGQNQAAGGVWRFDADALRLNQGPASPHPREGQVLSPRFAIDTNVNPLDARLDETRLHGSVAYDRPLMGGAWTTMLALTHSNVNTLRGFIGDLDARTGTGFEQSRRVFDIYFDSHLVHTPAKNVRLLTGIDYLGGSSRAVSSTFDYSIDRLDALMPIEDGITLRDRRSFLAGYAQSEWTPSPDWRIDAGLRLNHTSEHKGRSSDTNTRGSGFAGVSRRIGAGNWLFADYRNTFKPAVIDFGPEDEDTILRPETSTSYEIGVKHRDDRLFWQAAAFTMDMNNLVLAQTVNGQPALRNAGQMGFRGGEIEGDLRVTADVHVRGSLSRHDARFRDYVLEFDGVPTQLRGRRLEMSARDLASAGATFASGAWNGSVIGNYIGSLYLDKRNTALAPSYTTVDAGLGYRSPWGELRVDGRNLTDKRPAIAESEFGDAQYYLMAARSFRITLRRAF